MNGWIGVDLDGTLAEYHGWKGPGHIGAPIPVMVERVKKWIEEGKEVRIFTARAWPIRTLDNFVGTDAEIERAAAGLFAIKAIEAWCIEHIGQKLPVTCIKDYGMVELWDDRAVQVAANTGERADGRPE